MNYILRLGAVALVLSLLIAACNDPNEIGSELVAGDFSDIQFTDTITLRGQSTVQDSVFVYSPVISLQNQGYIVGKIDEPIFGVAQAESYVNLRLTQTSNLVQLPFLLPGASVFVDSVVLSLAYDTLRFYGDTLNEQSIEIYEVLEPMDNSKEYFSDTEFETSMTPLGTKSFMARPRTAVFEDAEDTVTTTPHLRIPLDNELGTFLLSQDSTVFSSSEDFQDVFKGIKIAPGASNNLMMGFDYSNFLTKLRVYYRTESDTTSYVFFIADLSTKVSHYEMDYTGSQVEPFIDNPTMGDSLLFVQGLSGLNAKLDFPYIENFEDVIVNKAELVFTVAALPGDDLLNFGDPERIVASYLDDNNLYSYIVDFVAAFSSGDLDNFGGSPEVIIGDMVTKEIRMNISNLMQDIMDGTADSNSIFLQVYLKGQYPQRTVLFGPGHSQFPAKLNLTYTKKQ